MTATYFDQWYADIDRSAPRQQLFTAGLALPEEVGPSNLVPLDGLREIAGELALSADDVLVDLACGRGGPGMWVAREIGVELVGIDFSPEAIRQASARRSRFGLENAATFAVGTLEDTGLAAGVADAVMCVDAIQFTSSIVDTAAEIRRILRRGGRLAMTSWQAVAPGDPHLSERIRDLDLATSLTAAGFAHVRVMDRPVWHAVAKRLWETTLAGDPGDDPALISLHEEGAVSLTTHDRLRRVLVTALAP